MSDITLKIDGHSLIIDLINLAKKGRKNYMDAPRQGNMDKPYEDYIMQIGQLSRLKIDRPPSGITLSVELLEAIRYWGNYND